LALIALSSLDFLTSELTKPIMFVIITAQNEGHSVICVNPIHDHDTSATTKVVRTKVVNESCEQQQRKVHE